MKLSLILLAALSSCLALRRYPAALRHSMLAAAIASAALLPLFEAVVPSWTVPFKTPAVFAPDERWQVAAPDVTRSERRESGGGAAIRHQPAFAESAASARAPLNLVFTVWMAGAAAGFALLAIGMLRLRRLALRAQAVTDERWLTILRELQAVYGLRRRVVLLQSDHASLLVTWGAVRPRVMLPGPAASWSQDRARVVLSHELAHITRGDWTIQIGAELVRAFYWFNPFLWLACRRLRLESERACDDEVINRGIAGTDYAGHLVELAREFNRHRQPWCPAPAMARPSSLERRVRAMLTDGLNRRPVTRSARAAIVAVCLAISAVVGAAQSGFVSFSGLVADQQGRVVPAVTVTLTNDARQSKYEVKTGADGRFEFVGLPAGEYGLTIAGAGFTKITEPLTIRSQNVQRNFTLRLGTLQETVNVKFDPRAPIDVAAPDTPVVKEARTVPPPRECHASPAGGNIVPPRKIRHAVPAYPRSLYGTGIEGTVTMTVRIGVDGYTSDFALVGEAHPDLAHAAIAAVREWRFTQTLLNCQPVEVTMTVTVNFQRAEPQRP